MHQPLSWPWEYNGEHGRPVPAPKELRTSLFRSDQARAGGCSVPSAKGERILEIPGRTEVRQGPPPGGRTEFGERKALPYPQSPSPALPCIPRGPAPWTLSLEAFAARSLLQPIGIQATPL